MTVTITLPLPPRELQPNRRNRGLDRRGRIWRSKLASSYRETVGWACVIHRHTFEGAATLRMEATIYHQSARNKLDDDNALGWLKAMYDGLQDGLAMNDRKFRRSIPEQLVDENEPRVVVRVSKGDL